MEIETCVALGAAVATALSAIFIGWQAWETRRSAESSNKAATASEAALGVANESLELNRHQANQAAFMVAEATRARLETNAPFVTMQFEDGENAQPEIFLVGKPSDPDSFESRKVGAGFRIPQDSDQWLYALFLVRFHNDGPLPVTIWSGSTIIPVYDGFPWEATLRLDQGESVVRYLAVGCSLERWTGFPEDKGKSRGEAGWVTELSGDSGVRLTQSFHIDGTLLEGGQREGDFTLRGLGPDVNWPSRLVKDQAKRTYWLGGREIPELAPDDVFGAAGAGIAK